MNLSVDQILRKAAAAAQSKHWAEAEQLYRMVLAKFPANRRAQEGLQTLAAIPPMKDMQAIFALCNQGSLEEAIVRASDLLASYPNSVDLHNITGIACARLGRIEEAVASFDNVLRLAPDYADAYNNRAAALLDLGRPDEALASLDKALQFSSDHADAHYNRGNALKELKRLDEAVASYDEALRLNPTIADAYNNRGSALRKLKRLDEALASFDNALLLVPTYPGAHNNRGMALQDLGRPDEAVASFDKALQFKPDYAEAHFNYGNALLELNHPDAALACYDKALQFNPDLADAYTNRGSALLELGRLDEAVASFAEALRLKPDNVPVLSQMLHQKAQMCDWSDAAIDERLLQVDLEGEAALPFAMLAAEDNPLRHLQRAQAWARERYDIAPDARFEPGARPDKLHIGYFSADFHDHAVMHQMARLFELHDKSRFEIHAFSYGGDSQDDMRQRLLNAFDAFHDVRSLSVRDIAALARDKGIDIAVDLMGYTRETRSGIFAHRAAPVQIGYLGFPGSMGADFIDYIVADKVVIPEAAQQFYSESVIYLPHSYQANDDRRVAADRVFTRAELGLPENGFVFCCFNNSYKISPAEFDVWMRLLDQVEGSVLWLLQGTRWVQANLRKEAEARGIDPDRLVFAERLPFAEYLACQSQADLFLDTFNYNAHGTASGALWAGVPIATKLGQGFASRVAASLLTAVGLPELVTDSVADYERLALELATHPEKLAKIKAKLAANRLTTPLFDAEQFTRHIEQAYDMAFERYASGLEPAALYVEA